MTAISFHAYPHVADKYALMPCGGSIGDGYGPLLVAREPLDPKWIAETTVAVPGTLTSAYLALQLFAPGVTTLVVPFDRILDEVREGRAEVGLVIHEGQLTYGGQGLVELLDLGAWWKDETGLPLPARRQRRAARPRAGDDGAAHPPRARDGEALAGPPPAGARVRDELRARDGPEGGRPLRRDVGERHDGRDGGARPAAPSRSSSTAASRPASSRSGSPSTSSRPEM